MAPVKSSRRRSNGPLTYAAMAAAVALGASGCSLDLSDLTPGGGDEPSATEAAPVDAAPVFEGALEQLRSAPAVAVQGKVAAGEGKEGVNDTALTVTSAGTTQGTYKEGRTRPRCSRSTAASS
ncbi:hypothetical protein ACFQXA_16955 [Nocardiopsis composta]